MGAKRKTEADYHALASENGIKWTGCMPQTVNEKTEWECPEGHTWLAPYKNIYLGTGCPHCAGLAPKTEADYHALAAERGFKWRGCEAPKNTETNTEWECRGGHTWLATYHNIKLGTGCPHCYGYCRGRRKNRG